MGDASSLFRRRYALHDPELDGAIESLVERAAARFGSAAGADYVRQIAVTALALLRDGASVGDLKLTSGALKELRHSFRVFAPYRPLRKVAVFGSARTPPGRPDWEQARRFAARIAEQGWMVITGAGAGIMGAAQGGAGREASFGVNIRLPFEQRANEVIAEDPKLINFRYFFTRKVTFVKEAHAIVLFPGGFGTHDEGFEALTLIQTGKSEILPVVFVDSPGGTYWRDWESYVRSHLVARGLVDEHDLALFRITDDADIAVREVVDFYRNYHSSRYVGDRLVLRVRRQPSAAELAQLNDEYRDVLVDGRIEVSGPLAEEADEVPRYPRVVLRFDRRSPGRLRGLIDRLNTLAPAPESPCEASPHQIVDARLRGRSLDETE